MDMNASTLDERHAIGSNQPPESGFDAIRVHIEDLYSEAKNWLDGEPITNQAQADEVAKLLNMIREAEKTADEQRKAEAKPFDDGKAAVQAKYAPLIADTKAVRGKTVLAAEACKAALAPWLKKLEDEKRAAAEAARREAEEKARAAAEAARAAQASADLDAMEAAEALVADARQAEKAATRAENDKAHASGYGRAVGLRSFFTPVLTDPSAALMHYVKTQPDAVKAFLTGLAEQDVRTGKRQIPGFVVEEERRAV
jgi:hypothetical protein